MGIDVHRGARIGAAAHGGQIVLSKPLEQRLAGAIELRSLGEHRLKDLGEPEWLFQPLVAGLPAEFPPLKTLSTSNLPMPARRLIGRERELQALVAALDRQPAGDDHRQRRQRQDPAGGRGRVGAGRPLSQRRLLRRPGGAVVGRDGGAGAGRRARRPPAAGRADRPGAGRRTSATAGRCSCSTTSSTSARPRRWWRRLLEAARYVTVLVTSREPLRLSAEHEFALLPLPEQRCGRAVRRAHRRRRAGRPGGGRAVPAAGRPAARDRAGRRPRQAAVAAGDARADADGAAAADRGCSRPAGPAADAARDHRLELSAAGRARSGGCCGG